MFVSLWVPPPSLAKLSVPNSYNHKIPHPNHYNFISVCSAAGCLYYLYMFILTKFPVRLLLLFFEFLFHLSINFSFWFCSLLNFLRLYGSYLRKVSFFWYILRSDNIYNLCQLHFPTFWAAIFGSKKDIKKSKRHKQFTIHNANK